MASPLKLTIESMGLIVKMLRAGNYKRTAAAAANVHYTRLYAWLRRGLAEEAAGIGEPGLYELFAVSVRKAEAEFCVKAIAEIRRQGHEEGKWVALAWRLSKMYPSKWGEVTPRYMRALDARNAARRAARAQRWHNTGFARGA
jgi:hypothetical protein